MMDKKEFNRLEAWASINKDVPENSEAANIIQRVLDGEKIKIRKQSRPKTDLYDILFSWAWAYENTVPSAVKEFGVDRNTIKKRIGALAKSLDLTYDDLMEKDIDLMSGKAKKFITEYFKNDYILTLYDVHKEARKKGDNIL